MLGSSMMNHVSLQLFENSFDHPLLCKCKHSVIPFYFAAHAVLRKWVLLTDPDDKMAGVKVGKEDRKVLFFYPIQIMTRRLLLYSLNKKM